MKKKFLRCPICGNLVEVINDSNVRVMCCGKPMEELVANTTDGATEKHVPVVEINNELVKMIASAHNRSVAQILLRYALERGVLPLPKTTHLERMLENQKLFDFALSEKEMSDLNNLPLCAWSGEHPDNAIPWDD